MFYTLLMLEITDQICGSHWNPYAMDFYPYNRRIMESCGLTSLPDRRTFDRRLSTISADIKERIATMANLFVKEKLVDPYIIAIDSRLLRGLYGTNHL
jgi:hypothetical protein